MGTLLKFQNDKDTQEHKQRTGHEKFLVKVTSHKEQYRTFGNNPTRHGSDQEEITFFFFLLRQINGATQPDPNIRNVGIHVSQPKSRTYIHPKEW